MRRMHNPRASRAPYTERERRVVSVGHGLEAQRELAAWAEYAPTPLRQLPHLAQALGVAKIHYKDESRRFGLGSFKALGGAYASAQALRRFCERTGQPLADHSTSRPTLSCATDGNHGRAVAFAARRFGCACVVFMHEHAPQEKEGAIRALGARIVRIPGTYDDSVAVARETSAANGWIPIMDTSQLELDETVIDVMSGYAVIALEILTQGLSQLPTHVFVQAGVGGLAAAMAGIFSEQCAASRPTMIVVEPQRAACVLAAVAAGRPQRLQGDLSTAMEMLSCGEVSRPAWTILEQRVDACVALDDASARAAQWRLQQRVPEPLDVGVSGAASVAGLIACTSDASARAALDLGAASRVLVFGTEAADRSAACGETGCPR